MTVLMNNLRRIFGRPINIILMIVVPVVLNIFFISISGSAQKYTIGVIDCDKSQLTESLLNKLSEEAEIKEIEDNEEIIRSALLNSEIDLALKFDENYAQKIMNGEDAKIQTFAITETNLSEPIRILISSFASSAREIGRQADGDSEKFYKAIDNYVDGTFSAEYDNFEFSSKEKVSRAVTSLGYLAMGMMFLMTFATTLLLEDKETRVYSRIITTPVTRASYLFQHLLSYLIVAVIQIALIFLIIPNIVEISFGSTTTIEFETMLVTLLFSGVCIAIGLTVSRFSKSSSIAAALVSLINFPVLMLGGCLWPREIMPEGVQRIGDFMPTTWFLNAASSVLNGEGLGAAGKEMLLLGGLILILLILSFVVKTDEKY
jgi:ABC-2 type transport system permease protein